jgi:hypothetical protein
MDIAINAQPHAEACFSREANRARLKGKLPSKPRDLDVLGK